MLRFHLSLGLALCLTALPVLAADKSESIPLTHFPAAELDRILSAEQPARKPAPGAVGVEVAPAPKGVTVTRETRLRPFGIIVPAGITAWAVDVRKNALSVSGSEEAIEQLKQIIRILDVPARRLRISTKLFQLDAAAAEELRKRSDAQVNEGIVTLPVPDNQKAALEARPSLLAAQVNVSNNHPVYVRQPAVPGQAVQQLTLQPRLNGDGSITIVSAGILTAQEGEEAFLTLRRVPSGMSLLVLDSMNRAWVLTPELLPE